jgi:hypothetical protein
MRIIYNKTVGVLSKAARLRLRRLPLHDLNATAIELNGLFPHQIITGRSGRFQVSKKDGSVILDVLQDGRNEVEWVEAVVNIRMTIL